MALLDRSDYHHAALATLFRDRPGDWVIPWAVLPEADYLIARTLGREAQDAFLQDLSDGAFAVVWGGQEDLLAASSLHFQYCSLGLGLVDCAVIAVAERLAAGAIATLDLRHFGAVAIAGEPRLYPRDL